MDPAPSHIPMEPGTGRVESLEVAADHIRRYGDYTRDRALRARAAGATWSEIAAPLGVSRQAAWRRFHQHCPQGPVRDRDEQLIEQNLKSLKHFAERSSVLADRIFDLVQ